MNKKQEKMCVDCLHCKVSAKSTENEKLYFCAKSTSAKRQRELYWLTRKPCKAFESMND